MLNPKIEFREGNPIELAISVLRPCPICGKYPIDQNSWAGSVGDLGFGIYCRKPCIEEVLMEGKLYGQNY